MAGRAGVLVVLALAATMSSAGAQPVSDAFTIERFRLPLHQGVLDVDTPDVLEHGRWGLGLWVGLARDPLVVYDETFARVSAVVSRRLTSGLVGSVGLWDRLELGMGLDVVTYQQAVADNLLMNQVASAGLGDLRIGGKLRAAGSRDSVWQLGLLATATIPLGDAHDYLREDSPTITPELAGQGRSGRWRFAANAGVRIRKRLETVGFVVDDEAFARAGVAVNAGATVEVALSASLALALSNGSDNQQAREVLLGADLPITGPVRGFVAIGLGLNTGVGVPEWRSLAGARFTSRIAEPTLPPRPRPPLVPPVPPAVLADITGTVLDAAGRAVVGATVTATFKNIQVSAVATDDTGRFVFARLPIGHRAGGAVTLDESAAQIDVRATDMRPGTATLAPIAPGPNEVPPIVLAPELPPGQLRGVVRLLPGGTPVAGAVVTITPGDVRVTTTVDGSFAVDIAPGKYRIRVEGEQLAPQELDVTIDPNGVAIKNIDLFRQKP